jgi:hypothetical protein
MYEAYICLHRACVLRAVPLNVTPQPALSKNGDDMVAMGYGIREWFRAVLTALNVNT